MNEFLYNGISLAALVVGVVQVIKKAGLSGRAVQWLAIGLAFVVFAGGKLAAAYPAGRDWYELALAGLYGVSAVGLYETAKNLAGGGQA